MIHQFDIFSGAVAIRADLEGLIVRPEALRRMEGKRYFFEALCLQDDEDKYPGEWMLGPADAVAEEALRAVGIGWISSGDVIVDG